MRVKFVFLLNALLPILLGCLASFCIFKSDREHDAEGAVTRLSLDAQHCYRAFRQIPTSVEDIEKALYGDEGYLRNSCGGEFTLHPETNLYMTIRYIDSKHYGKGARFVIENRVSLVDDTPFPNGMDGAKIK